MSATIHQLHNTPPIAGFIRVGHIDHKWIEERLSAGRMPYRRFVFDAAHVDKQRGLLGALKKAGHEVILDTNFAELCSVGRFNGAASVLPWANQDRPWQVEDLGGNRARFLASQMAEFAVERDVDAVLSPSQLIEVKGSGPSIDANLAEALRVALDASGGGGIALDYQVITTMNLLRDDEFRRDVAKICDQVDCENVWLRASGFDAQSTGAATKRFVENMAELHGAGKPFVGDMIGGLPAIGAAAAGAIGAICHGSGGRESFRIADYRKIPTGGGGGGKRRVFLAGLGRWVSEEQFEKIVGTKGAKSKLFCRDKGCCPQGRDDMIDEAKGHFLNQRNAQIRELSRIPEERRLDHFLAQQLGAASSLARTLSRLDYEDDKTAELVSNEKKRLFRMADSMRALGDNAIESRSLSPVFRGGGPNVAVIAGRS
ncbi:hypothetical protein [Erythrobacter ani]|uniref:Uncharacterized protein n=1 Tax=Erythrobacter ani TaxID=2827235 RepID=A0ABS6SP05_9SPHN|nr:hypothetical protein [Erythrobacter ani]MBV7266761.1 hypothetical protein [Erythrobacter ani]